MTNIDENINFWDSFIDIKCSKIENNDVYKPINNASIIKFIFFN